MAKGNNSGNGNNEDYKMASGSSGYVKAPNPIERGKDSPGKKVGNDLRIKK